VLALLAGQDGQTTREGAALSGFARLPEAHRLAFFAQYAKYRGNSEQL
jgi:hypothetical protein